MEITVACCLFISAARDEASGYSAPSQIWQSAGWRSSVNCVPWSPGSQHLTVIPSFHLHSLFHCLCLHECACVCVYKPGYCCLAQALHSPPLTYSLLGNGAQTPWSVFSLFLRVSYMGSCGLRTSGPDKPPNTAMFCSKSY